MRKIASCGLTLTLFCVAGTSHAQSSVTLYGVIDTGFTYTSNAGGHSNVQQASGKLSGNRWGLLGAEDLGNGLKAIFTLENGFNLSNGQLGQNGREFGRQSFVGLSDSQFGRVTLGRQYMSSLDYIAPLSLVSSAGNLAAHPYDNDNLNNSLRIGNSVKFESVNYGGFKFGGLYGFSNAAGSFADSRAYDISASYVFGGLTVASTYMQLNNGGSTTNTSGAIASGDSTFNAGRQHTWGAAANYAIGTASVGLVFTQTQLGNATAIESWAAGTSSNLPLTHGSARFTNYELNGRYRFTPEWTLMGGYVFTDARLDGVSPKYHQITALADYALSKRTDLYAEAAFQHVTRTGNPSITADLQGISSSSTRSQIAVSIGFRQRF